MDDMILTSDQYFTMMGSTTNRSQQKTRFSRQAKEDLRYRWPHVIMHFELANDFTLEEKTYIRKTLEKLQDKLDRCVIFKECRFCPLVYRVFVSKGSGCNSDVGYLGGRWREQGGE